MNAQEIKKYVNAVSDFALQRVENHEELSIVINGEISSFLRFNRSKVRQVTGVEQSYMTLNYQVKGRSASHTLSLSFDEVRDMEKIQKVILELKKETPKLPEDIHQSALTAGESSENINEGDLKDIEELIELSLKPLEGLDVSGFLSSGPIYRAAINSKGNNHFYYGENFFVDFSLFDKDQNAVKGFYGGSKWDQTSYEKEVLRCKEFLSKMSVTKKEIPKGKYKTYFAPAAVSEIVSMFGWYGVSMKAVQHVRSAFTKLYNKEKELSEKVNFNEDFSLGLGPKFNSRGELSKEKIEIIKEGKCENLLTSSRSAKEFGVESNGAGEGEAPRSPCLSEGALKEEEILEKLGTGLYISNLHYLNWSDTLGGRITGMTRYACFWVEDGKIIAPIKDLRFDESLYNFFGENLIDFTNFVETFPSIGTYGSRSVGGMRVPGMLVDGFTFTL